MAETVDIIENRLELLGLGGWLAGYDRAGGAVESLAERTERSAARMAAVSAASGAAAVAGFRMLFDAAAAAGGDEATFERAAGNFKGAFPREELEDFAGGLEDLTGVADDAIAGAVGLLGTFKLTRQEAKDLTLPILNAAEALKAQGVSAEALAVAVGKAAQSGDSAGLRRMGIIIEEGGFKAASATERVRVLTETLQGQGGDAAIAFRQTFEGSMQAAQTALGSLQEAVGAPLVKPITDATNVVVGFAKAVTNADPVTRGLVTTLAVGAVGALGAVSIATGIAATRTLFLAEAHLKAAAAARVHAAAESQVAGSVGGGRTAGGGSGRFGGIGLGLASLGLTVGGEAAVQNAGESNSAGDAFSRIGGRTAQGAGLGLIGGPQGAIVGALLGMAIGSIETIAKGSGSDKPVAKSDPVVEAVDRVQEAIDRQTRVLGEAFALSTSDVAAIQQRAIGAGSLPYLLA